MIQFAHLKSALRAALISGILAAPVFDHPAIAQIASNDPVFQAYLDRVAELNRDGRTLVQESGKGYLIGEYQALIDAHPEYEKNVQLETRIGEIYEWDYSNRGEPPDVESAYAVYLGIVDRYNQDYKYTKLVYRRAADRAESIDPAAARDLYAGMMQAYPDDPVVQIESLYRLGALAERDGDLIQARELFDLVLGYDASNQALNPDETERIETLQAQAASLLMALATDPSATPEERLAALNTFLDENPNLLDEHGDIAENFRSALDRLQDNAPRDEIREAMAELKAMLAERQDARALIGAPAGQKSNTTTAATSEPGGETGSPIHNSDSPQTVASVIDSAGSSEGFPSSPRAFARQETGPGATAENDGVSGANNRAAAMAAAVVCALLAAAGLFALRKRFGQ